jgi:hypothetical protein|tara:strand:+ start:724 stop:882 length:159 start_codon:yes stop_codon:yes gene_type:complete
MYRSETNIAVNGNNIAVERLRVRYGINTAIAITGVKFGGCGIILPKAIRAMR